MAQPTDIEEESKEFEPSEIYVSLEKVLNTTRINLLDLGKRNRLINCPKPKSRGKAIEVIDELSEEVFRLLVGEQRSMTFLPGREAESEEEAEAGDVVGVYLPPDDLGSGGVAERHIDKNLQTRLTPKGLQRRLLGIYRDERTLEEEQGVNVLFLALGFLYWTESDTSDIERLAPLVLIPVRLSRHDVRGHFTLSARDDDLLVNLSLQQMLKNDYGITLPDIADSEDFSPSAYLDEVSRAVSSKSRWKVASDEIILGFFSFTKLLMFRDLDPENWDEKGILKNPVINNLLGDGFGSEPSLFPDDKSLDDVLDPAELVHILDADGSQTIVIEDVKRGRNMVVQGPPGTGKSQTIANVIAAAAHAGKKVLFVAEKMAALDVVYRRLDRAGLGDLCLELHSRKASKAEVLAELERTLSAGKAIKPDDRSVRRLKEVRDKLNTNIAILHTPHEPSGVTPFQAIGEQVALKQNGLKVPDFTLPNAASWTREKAQEIFAAVANLSRLVEEAGPRNTHPWRGAQVIAITPADRDRLVPRISSPIHHLAPRGAAAGRRALIFRSPPTRRTNSLRSSNTSFALSSQVAGRRLLCPTMFCLRTTWASDSEAG